VQFDLSTYTNGPHLPLITHNVQEKRRWFTVMFTHWWTRVCNWICLTEIMLLRSCL